MGPHTDTCLDSIWNKQCMSHGKANPTRKTKTGEVVDHDLVYSSQLRSLADLGTLKAFSKLVESLAERAASGSAQHVAACYGSSRKCKFYLKNII